MRSAKVLPVVVAITLGLVGTAYGGTVIYNWYKARAPSRDAVAGAAKRKRKPKTEKVEMIIENETMPLVLGRNGSNIKSIEDRHQVKISFEDKNDGKHICKIEGEYTNVMKAVNAVSDEAKKSKSVTEELIIPRQAYLRINSTLSDICRDTTTKINISKEKMKDNSQRRLEISGQFPNVRKAKQLIEERVYQDSIDGENDIRREPRFNQTNSPVHSSDENLPKCNSD